MKICSHHRTHDQCQINSDKAKSTPLSNHISPPLTSPSGLNKYNFIPSFLGITLFGQLSRNEQACTEDKELEAIRFSFYERNVDNESQELFQVLNDRYIGEESRSCAAFKLALLRDPRGLRYLDNVLNESRENGIKRAKGFQISNLFASEKTLVIANQHQRKFAAKVLGYIGDPEATEILVKAAQRKFLNDWILDRSIHEKVNFALQGKRDKHAHIIWNVLFHRDISPDECCEPSSEDLHHEHPFIRFYAALQLGKRSDPAATKILLNMLHGKDSWADEYYQIPEDERGKNIIDALVASGNLQIKNELLEYGGPYGANAVVALDKKAAEEAEKLRKKAAAEAEKRYEKDIEQAEKENRLADAVIYYEQLITLGTQNFRYPLRLAHIYHQFGWLGKAMEACDVSIQLCSDCDGYTAQMFLATLREEQRAAMILPNETVFIGIIDLIEGQVRLADGLERSMEIAIFQTLRRHGAVVMPDISREIDANDIALCSESSCTAEIAGALGLTSGIYATITSIGKPSKWFLTLNLVNQKNQTITHKASITFAPHQLRNEKQAELAGIRLATKLIDTLKKR